LIPERIDPCKNCGEVNWRRRTNGNGNGYVCRTCSKKYDHHRYETHKGYFQIYARDNTTKIRNYYKNNKYKWKERNDNIKIRAMKIVMDANNMVGKIQCCIMGCGCDDLSLLQLNYKNGGHTALIRAGKLTGGVYLRLDIIAGRVDASLFEVMCRAHNSVDHLEKKAGHKLFDIKYVGSENEKLY